MKRIGYVLRRTFKAWPDDRIIQDYYAQGTYRGYWTNKIDQAKVFNSFGDAVVDIPIGNNLVAIEPIKVRENRSVIEERLYNK